MSTITDSIGRVLAGRYRIESALGSGASATVFAAWDVTLQRRVAIKVLHAGLASDGAFLRRFRAEAQAAAALTDPHVLSVYDWGEDTRGPFLILEFLGGGSLRDLLDNGTRLTVPQAVAVGLQAAEGLAYAHGRGFVHRDVKPANLLFDEDGRLRIADFGLARALAEAAWTEPVGSTVGTARYAAPEQALGQRVDGRSDVYSLALVLYEAVTGVVPFTADTTISTLMARVGNPLPPHDGLGPLANVLEAAAMPEAGDRLDAPGLARRLRQLKERLPAAKPLPLAGAGGEGVVTRDKPEAEIDRTQHEIVLPAGTAAASGTAVAGAAPADAEGGDVMAMAQAVGLTDERHRPKKRSWFRRWGYKVAILVVVLALAGGGAAVALAKTKILIPSHRLPVILNLTVAQAQQTLHKDHLTVRVVGNRASLTVPTGGILRQIPGPHTLLKQGAHVGVVLSTGPPPVTVPALAQTKGDCPAITSILTVAHLKSQCSDVNSTTVATGTVISWSPQGQAPYNSVVVVTVSSGPPIEMIPSLTGSTCTGATTALMANGLVAMCNNESSQTVPNGQVISWSPTGTAHEGATVTVNISTGPPPVNVPDVIGMTVAQAIGALEQAGLNPGTDQGPLSGQVFATNPSGGTSVPEGTTVTLYSK